MDSQAISTTRVILPILGSFAGGSLYGWSGYLPAVRASFGTSHALTSLVFSVAIVSFAVGVLIGPYILSQRPAQFRLAIISLFAALSLGIAAISPGFWMFLGSYGVFFGFLSGALYTLALSQASKSLRPTLFIPISVAAFGLGGAAFGPVFLWLGEAGAGLWSTFPVTVCLVIVGCAALLFKESAQTTIPETAKPQFQLSFPNREIAKLWLIFALGSCPGLIVLGLASQLIPSGSGGVTLMSIAILGAALGNTTGRLATTLIAWRFGPARSVAFSMILSGISLVCLASLTAPFAVIAALFSVAFAYGHLAAGIPLLVERQVGSEAFSTSFGWVFTAWGTAGLAGPWAAGWLLDRTGEFTIILGLCTVFVLIGFWLSRGFIADQNMSEARASR